MGLPKVKAASAASRLPSASRHRAGANADAASRKVIISNLVRLFQRDGTGLQQDVLRGGREADRTARLN